MNALPGSRIPARARGRVETPRGVLFTGDTTDNGLLEEFAEFETVYGLTGKDGLLRYPVFEAIGNHDVNDASPIKERARQRHGGIDYAWDWDDVRLACLDMYPDARTLAWLARDLETRGRERPMILYFHYSLEGYYSDFWEQEEKDAFATAIGGHNVLAIFHGHEHRVGHYGWRGHPVFRPGAPRHSSHAFLVVRVGAREMAVAAWDFDRERWLSPGSCRFVADRSARDVEPARVRCRGLPRHVPVDPHGDEPVHGDALPGPALDAADEVRRDPVDAQAHEVVHGHARVAEALELGHELGADAVDAHRHELVGGQAIVAEAAERADELGLTPWIRKATSWSGGSVVKPSDRTSRMKSRLAPWMRKATISSTGSCR